MRTWYSVTVALIIFLMVGAASAESDIPDLKGTWEWTDQAVRHFRSSGVPDMAHTKHKNQFAEISFTLKIDKQDGFRFSGTKISKKWKESVSGVIGFDNKTVYMVDDNGFLICKLVSPDKMEQIYLHVIKTHSVAARGIMIRKR